MWQGHSLSQPNIIIKYYKHDIALYKQLNTKYIYEDLSIYIITYYSSQFRWLIRFNIVNVVTLYSATVTKTMDYITSSFAITEIGFNYIWLYFSGSI